MRTQPEGLPLKYRAVVGATRLVSGSFGLRSRFPFDGGIPVAVISSPRNPNPIVVKETRRRAFVLKV